MHHWVCEDGWLHACLQSSQLMDQPDLDVHQLHIDLHGTDNAAVAQRLPLCCSPSIITHKLQSQ